MVTDELWKRLTEEYEVDGYTDSIVYIKLEQLIKLDSKIKAIEDLLKSQQGIKITPQGFYSVQHIWPSQGEKIVKAIMKILFDYENYINGEV